MPLTPDQNRTYPAENWGDDSYLAMVPQNKTLNLELHSPLRQF